MLGKTPPNTEHRLLALIMVITFLKGATWAALVPLWQAPDEYTHYAPVQFIAEHGRLPGPDDFRMSRELCLSVVWLQTHTVAFRPMNTQTFAEKPPHPVEAQLAELPDDARWTPAETGCHSAAMFLPPLYYLLGAGVYRIVYNADYFVRAFSVRLLSVVLTAITVLLTWLITREVFPASRALRLTVTVAVAFHPMFTFLGAVINTDSLLFCLSTALIYISVRIVGRGLTLQRAFSVGVLVGLGILTKPHIYSTLPALGVALLLACWRRKREWRRWILMLALIGLTALLVGGWWVFRSVQLNDNPFYASPASELWGTKSNANYSWTVFDHLSLYEQRLQTILLRGYWGNFGWTDTLMPGTLYVLMRWASYLAMAGLVVYTARSAAGRDLGRQQRGLLIAAVASASIIGILGFYGFTSMRGYGVFQPSQGRYLLNMIAAQMLLLVFGLIRLTPHRLHATLQVATRVGFIGMNVAALALAIVPRYYSREGDLTATLRGWAPVQSADGDRTAGLLVWPRRDDVKTISLWVQVDYDVEQVQLHMEEVIPSGRKYTSSPITVPGGKFPVEMTLPARQSPVAYPLYLSGTSVLTPGAAVSVAAITDGAFRPRVKVEFRSESAQDWLDNLSFTWRVRFDLARTLFGRFSQLKPSFFQGRALASLLALSILGMTLLAKMLVTEPGTERGPRRWLSQTAGIGLGVLFVIWGFEVGQTPDWIAVPLSASSDTGSSADVEIRYDLALAMDDSTSTVENPGEYVDLRWEDIYGKAQPAVWMHAPSAVTYQVDVPFNAELVFDLALDPATLDRKLADGVAFIVSIGPNEPDEIIFWEAVDPNHNPEHREWLSRSIDLSAYAGQSVYLKLQTQPLANNNWDFSMWGSPRIVTRPAH
jgi:4-amino-4-deoxy-L-arabinose transferase-like glycosyltransferase